MFTPEELGLITYALIVLKVQEQDDPIDGGETLAEVTELIKKIREMKGGC